MVLKPASVLRLSWLCGVLMAGSLLHAAAAQQNLLQEMVNESARQIPSLTKWMCW